MSNKVVHWRRRKDTAYMCGLTPDDGTRVYYEHEVGTGRVFLRYLAASVRNGGYDPCPHCSLLAHTEDP